MRHWDLIPGETVTLERPDRYPITATFRFRTTLLACFERPLSNGTTEWIELELLESGGVREPRYGAPWYIADRVAAAAGAAR